MTHLRADLFTVGETLIRLAAPSTELLARTRTLELQVGGAESNVAAGVTAMGYTTRWISRLTENVWGRRIVHDLTGRGVDCSGVIWTSEDRIGTYFVEYGVTPRPIKVTYDRAHSSMSRMTVEDIDLSVIRSARLIHLTGITAALSDSCYEVLRAVISEANSQGIPVVFDVNYRSLLWSPQRCAERLTPLLQKVDTLLIGRADAATVFGITGEPGEVLARLVECFGVKRVALTIGEAGAQGLDVTSEGKPSTYTVGGYPAQIVDRIGAGDAFAAGVLCGLLENNFELGVRYGVAMSALKLSVYGDMFPFTKEEVQHLIDHGYGGRPVR
jgi:2-dehydro-3-deoxygluconokinase